MKNSTRPVSGRNRLVPVALLLVALPWVACNNSDSIGMLTGSGGAGVGGGKGGAGGASVVWAQAVAPQAKAAVRAALKPAPVARSQWDQVGRVVATLPVISSNARSRTCIARAATCSMPTAVLCAGLGLAGQEDRVVATLPATPPNA
jgi:hypothetical protein